MVDFSARTIDSTTVSDSSALTTLIIAGSFADNKYGLITGTTTLSQTTEATDLVDATKTDYTGILTGLIGLDGAVGAFISDNALEDMDYVGAFVAIGGTCIRNPFDDSCDEDSIATDARTRIILKCSVASPPTSDDECNILLKPLMCIAIGDYANPFAELCDDVATIPAARQEACLANTEKSRASGVTCPPLIRAVGVNDKVWTYTATKTDGTDLLRDTIERGYAENPENDTSPEFWGAGQTVLEVRARSEIDSFDIIELNLATGGGDTLLGEVGDGAGYGTVAWNATDAPDALLAFNKKFAWILPTTNLGQELATPTDGQPTTAIWHGRASLLFGSDTFTFDNLELMVDFNARLIDSTTITTTPNDALMTTLTIDGSFDADEYGLITGTTTVSQTVPRVRQPSNYWYF